MSKEKNLVIYKMPVEGTVAVNGKSHTYMECYTDDPRSILTAPSHYISGPAIDRLYEFEKLGMEPEEIKTMKVDSLRNLQQLKATREELHLVSSAIYGLQPTVKIEKLQEENENLTKRCKELEDDRASLVSYYADKLNELNELLIQHANLQARNDNQLKTIQDLNEENDELQTQVMELKKDLENAEMSINSIHKNQDVIIFNNLIEITDLKSKLKRKTDEYNEKIMAMSADIDRLQEENEKLKKDRDAYRETAEMYREKCVYLETKPLTVEEYEEYLDDLAKKYNLISFKSTNSNIHMVILTDSKHLYSDIRIIFSVYIDSNNFEGSKEIMKHTENQLRQKLNMEPLED